MPRSPRNLLVALLLATLPGCLVSSPIEPEPFPPNYPPFLDEDNISPRDEVVSVVNELVELSVTEVLDPNNEPELFFIWRGERSGGITDGELQPLPETSGNEETSEDIFMHFEGSTQIINRCGGVLENSDSETITFYVSDRELDTVNGVVVAAEDEGAFLVKRSWTLRFLTPCL